MKSGRSFYCEKPPNRSYNINNKYVELSPYDKNYRGCMKADQRNLICHRQYVHKLPRAELEDRYISLCDENFNLKRENHENQDKIKKLATKLLRACDTQSVTSRSREKLSAEESLQIRIFHLEAQNSQLREKLQKLNKKFGISSRPSSELLHPVSFTDPFKLKACKSNDDVATNFLQISPNISNDDVPKLRNGRLEAGGNNTRSTSGDEKYGDELEKTKNEVSECQNQLKETLEKLDTLKDELEREKNKNSQIDGEKQKLMEELSVFSVRQLISENIEIIDLNRKLNEAEKQLKKAQKELNTVQSNDIAVIQDLKLQLKEAMDNKSRIENQLEEVEQHKKHIEELREQITQFEIEKQSLKTQQNSFSQILEDTMVQRQNNQELTDKNTLLLTQLTELKSSEIALSHSNHELMGKIKLVQDSSDELAIKIEGLKSEVKYLQDTNKILVDERGTLQALNKKLSESTTDKQLSDDIVRAKEEYDKIQNNIIMEKIDNKIKNNPIDQSANNNQTVGNRMESRLSHHLLLQKKSSGTVNPTRKSTKMKSLKKAASPPIVIKRNSNNSRKLFSTASDDEIYSKFKMENDEFMKNSLLIKCDEDRLALLEKAAFYRPLHVLSAVQNLDAGLSCECEKTGIDASLEWQQNLHDSMTAVHKVMLKEIKENPNNNDIPIDETKCRDLLRVQYNLNNLYKKEIKELCDMAVEHETKLKNELETVMKQLREVVTKSKIEIGENSLNIPNVLNVSSNEGTFEIHFEKFIMSAEGSTFLQCKHGEPGALYFSWQFYKNDYPSYTQFKRGPNYMFNCFTVHQIEIDENLFKYLMMNELEIELHQKNSHNNYAIPKLLGKSSIKLDAILKYPHNKIPVTCKFYVTNSEKSILSQSRKHSQVSSQQKDKYLGYLVLWIRLTCDLDELVVYRNQMKNDFDIEKVEHENLIDLDQSFDKLAQSVVEPNTQYVPIEDKVELGHPKERIFKNFDNLSNNLTQSEEDSLNFSIEIKSLQLDEGSKILLDASIKQLYIVYSFLHYKGVQMESPTSLTKPSRASEIVNYNFQIDFNLKSKENKDQLDLLRKMLHPNSKENIKFLLISEPNDKQFVKNDDLICQEVGFASLQLNHIFLKPISNKKVLSLPIYDIESPQKKVGTFVVIIEGVLKMKEHFSM